MSVSVKLTKREFADLCKMKTKHLSVYIGRKQVLVVDGLIDTSCIVNERFLKKHGNLPLIYQHNQCIKETFFEELDRKLLPELSQSVGLGQNELADVRSRMLSALERCMELSTKGTAKALDQVVKNFTTNIGV